MEIYQTVPKANENMSGGTQSKWKYIERYTKQMKTVNCDLNKTFYNFENPEFLSFMMLSVDKDKPRVNNIWVLWSRGKGEIFK